MTKILLNKRYWYFQGMHNYQVELITAEFKTQGLLINDSGKSCIIINKKGQKILYEELKKRFEK